MKLSEIKAFYATATGKVSDITRQLALAGVAVIWIFRAGGDNSGGIPFDQSLIQPLEMFIAALGLDFLHYVYYSTLWGLTNAVQWKWYGDNEREVAVCDAWHVPGNGLFNSKVMMMITGYFLLLKFLINKI